MIKSAQNQICLLPGCEVRSSAPGKKYRGKKYRGKGSKMPSAYTHARFGRSVYRELPAAEREIIDQNRSWYILGLQGPDLFFYYHPLKKNRVSRIGSRIHGLPGRTFFTQASAVVLRHPEDGRYLAYAWGSICHFTLDRECHYQVYEWTRLHGISHAEIEGELDRTLLIEDGKDPVRTSPTEGIEPEQDTGPVLEEFYREIDGAETGVTVREMADGVRSFLSFNRILLVPQKWKRKLIFSALKLIGQYESLHGHFINFEENPQCRQCSRLLRKKYDEAVPKAAELIREFQDTAAGKKPFSPLYESNYESDYPKGENG